jgi:hypothetical protein
VNVNDRLDFFLQAREYLATAPLEEIFTPEALARLHEQGLSDEDIRKCMFPPDAPGVTE